MNRSRPRLRNGVDLQLQSAFQDGNWAVAVRLAQQRARSSNDQYFDVTIPRPPLLSKLSSRSSDGPRI